MTQDRFWELVEVCRTRGGDSDAVVACLTDRLRELPSDEVLSFLTVLSQLEARSYTWELWGAAYVAKGGCSNDSFDYFRYWLILQGRELFEAALADPDSLADLVPEDFEFEDAWTEAIDQLTADADELLRDRGIETPDSVWKPVQDALQAGPSGEEWDEEDLERLYPRLTRRKS